MKVFFRRVNIRILSVFLFAIIASEAALADKNLTAFALNDSSYPGNSGAYTGLGIGVSHFDPTRTGSNQPSLRDQNSAVGHLFLGAFLKPRIAAEVNASVLGTLEFSPAGSVDYRVLSASALGFLSDANYSIGSRQFRPFLRIGARHYAIEADNVNIVRQSESNLLLGAGFNMPLAKHLALRFDAISYSKDAIVLQLGIMLQPWAKKSTGNIIAMHAQPEEQLALEENSPPSAAALSLDSDDDQVEDAVDECPNTLPRLEVESTGCPVYNGIVSGVNFELDSDKLTLNAQRVLIDVAKTLKQHPRSAVDVHAYTDSAGSEPYNLSLSELRALAVSNFLVEHGVGRNRLNSVGFGEQSPIDTNNTKAGRANNRRVELFAYRPE